MAPARRPIINKFRQDMMRRKKILDLPVAVTQNMCWPPLIEMLAPVTNAASSEHR